MPLQKDADSESEWRRNLEERLASMETALRAGNTSIDKGQLRVKPDTGSARVLTAGKAISDSSGTYDGIRVARQDDQPAIRLARYGDGTSKVSIHDAHGNEIFGDDRVSGYGLVAPAMAIPHYNTRAGDLPTHNSSAFTVIQSSWFPQQHSGIALEVEVITGATDDAEFRVTYDYSGAQNNTVIWGPVTAPKNTALYYDFRGPVPHPEFFGRYVQITLWTRITGGTATVAGTFTSLVGIPAP